MNKEDGSWRFIYVGPAGQLIGSLKPPQNLQFPRVGGIGTPANALNGPGTPAQPGAIGQQAPGATQPDGTAAGTRQLVLGGTGEELRDWTDIRDVVRALEFAMGLASDPDATAIFNVAASPDRASVFSRACRNHFNVTPLQLVRSSSRLTAFTTVIRSGAHRNESTTIAMTPLTR